MGMIDTAIKVSGGFIAGAATLYGVDQVFVKEKSFTNSEFRSFCDAWGARNEDPKTLFYVSSALLRLDLRTFGATKRLLKAARKYAELAHPITINPQTKTAAVEEKLKKLAEKVEKLKEKASKDLKSPKPF